MPKRKNIRDEDEDYRVIELVIVDQEHKKTYFKVRCDTKMIELFRTYGVKRNENHRAFDFFYGDTGRITLLPRSTPAKLGMEDGDVIAAMENRMGA